MKYGVFTYNEICETGQFNHDDKFVLKSDYDSLAAENEKLKTTLKRIKNVCISGSGTDSEALHWICDEIEALEKAGQNV